MVRSRAIARVPRPRGKLAWNDNVVHELLAWAEHCRKRDGSGSYFEATIVSHLKHSVDVDFTYKEIDDKIRELAKSAVSPLSNMHYTYLYKTNGAASSIPCIIRDRAARAIFNRRVMELDKDPNSRPTTGNSISPRHQVSNNSLDKSNIRNTPTERVLDKMSEASPRLRRKRRKRRSKRNYSSEVPQTPSSVYEDASSMPNSPKAPSVSANNSLSAARERSVSTIDEHLTQSYNPNGQSADHLFRNGLKSRTLETNDCSKETYLSELFSASPSKACGVPSCQSLVTELYRNFLYLSRELQDEKSKTAELNAQLDADKNVKRLLEQESLEELRKRLEQYERELQRLKNTASEKSKLARFLDNVKEQKNMADIETMATLLRRIHHKIDDLFQNLPEQDVEILPMLKTVNPHLQTLCRRIFGSQIHFPHIVGCRYLARSLVSAAICEWVFESELRDMCTTSSLLTETLLSQISKLAADDDVAKALHFSANKVLLDGSYFQDEIIPRKATRLAQDLQDILGGTIASWFSNPHTPIEMYDEWGKKAKLLIETFTLALKLKAHVLPTNEIFEVVFPEPGACMEKKYVHLEEPVSAIRHKPSTANICFTDICLTPGLRSQPHTRNRVDYHSFRNMEDVPLEEGEIVVNPRILVRVEK